MTARVRPDLVVVGAGIGGSTLAGMARTRGLRVELWDGAPERAASHAGLALLRKTWHDDTSEALEWYDRLGALESHPVLQTDDSGAERWGRGYHRVDPRAALLVPSLRHSWAPNAPTRAAVTVLSHPVVCDGSEPGVTFGVSWRSPTAKVPGAGVRIHWNAPYQAVIAVRDGDGAMVGASVGNTMDKARERGLRMRELAESLGMVTQETDWEALEGARHPISEPRELEPGLWDLGGFGRLGFTLAPARARRLLEDLGL